MEVMGFFWNEGEEFWLGLRGLLFDFG